MTGYTNLIQKIAEIKYFNCPDPGRKSENIKENDKKKFKIKIINKPLCLRKVY